MQHPTADGYIDEAALDHGDEDAAEVARLDILVDIGHELGRIADALEAGR